MNRKIIVGIVAIIALALGSAVWSLVHAIRSHVSTTAPYVEPVRGHVADLSHLPVVYASDFANGPDDGWTESQISRTPSGQSFLGKFGNDVANLTVSSLPAHERVRVSFDLFIIDTWDGSGRISAAGGPCGPDYFQLDLVGGPNLVRATFSALPDIPNFAETGKTQTYPWPIPTHPAKTGTGASGVNTLGYIFTFNPPGVSFPMDGVYPMSFTLPHTAGLISLDFSAAGLSGVSDESWGIANVKIEALPADEKPAPSPEAMQPLWNAVLGDNAIASHDAFWRLVSLGDATAHFIDQTAAGFDIDPATAETELAALSENRKDKTALAQLIAHGPAVEPVLRAIVAHDPEYADAMDLALREIEVAPIESPAARKAAAASRLLGLINTPLALSVQARLTTLQRKPPAEGSPEYAAEWPTRFDTIYQLAPNELVRFIPRPAPPERATFVDAYMHRMAEKNHVKQLGSPQVPYADMAMVIHTPDRITQDTFVSFYPPAPNRNYQGPIGLMQYVSILYAQGNGMKGWGKVIAGPEFDKLNLPGDWVIRESQPQAVMLKELSRIIVEQTGRTIQFQPQADTMKMIVVRGAYAFKPLTGVAADDTAIHITADEPDSKYLGFSPMETNLGSIFANITGDLGYQFENKMDAKSRKIRVKWLVFPSARASNQPSKQLSPEQLARILKNFSDQTSLTFTVEDRPMEKLIATETPSPKQPATKP